MVVFTYEDWCLTSASMSWALPAPWRSSSGWDRCLCPLAWLSPSSTHWPRTSSSPGQLQHSKQQVQRRFQFTIYNVIQGYMEITLGSKSKWNYFNWFNFILPAENLSLSENVIGKVISERTTLFQSNLKQVRCAAIRRSSQFPGIETSGLRLNIPC